MTRYDVLIRGGVTFGDRYPATSFGFTRERIEEIPEIAAAREDL